MIRKLSLILLIMISSVMLFLALTSSENPQTPSVQSKPIEDPTIKMDNPTSQPVQKSAPQRAPETSEQPNNAPSSSA